jgi:Vitamin B12 dependent methionine synthase, activation domain
VPQLENSSRRSSHKDSSPLIAEVCTDLKLAPPSREEVYRYLGYAQRAAPGAAIASRIEQVVEEARACLEPRGAFALYAIDARSSGSLTFGGNAIKGQVAEFMATADRVGVFAATVGDKVSKRGTQARQQGDTLAEWVIDAFGSWAAEAATDLLMERVRCHALAGEALTLRYSPGYCGMGMDQQQILFQMVRAEAIGMELLPSMLMYPLKSVSGIVGLGPKEKIVAYRAPCDRCDRTGCHMRR